jgi:hypothetical protein
MTVANEALAREYALENALPAANDDRRKPWHALRGADF